MFWALNIDSRGFESLFEVNVLDQRNTVSGVLVASYTFGKVSLSQVR